MVKNKTCLLYRKIRYIHCVLEKELDSYLKLRSFVKLSINDENIYTVYLRS